MSILWLTSGQPGSGKTYSRVKWLIEDFLPNNNGLYITNLPLKVEKIAEYVAENFKKNKDDIVSRIIIIPQEEFDLWVSVRTMRKGGERERYLSDQSYPAFSYFSQFDLTNAHIAIDEFHKIYGKGFSTDILKLWGDWFSEIRKTGATFEAITQCLDKLSTEYISLVGLRVELVQARNLRDPLFKILMYDWYQLRSGMFGNVEEKVIQTEYIKAVSFTGRVKWKEQHVTKFVLSPDYWDFYESYTKSSGETGQTTTPADQHGKKIWKWFLRRNIFAIFTRGCVAVFFIWLLVGGGVPLIFGQFMKFFASGCGGMLNSKKQSNIKQVEKQHNYYSSSPSGGAPVPSVAVSNQLQQIKQIESMYESDKKLRRPVLFFDDSCWLKSGEKVSPGYKFKGGYYEGKKILSINVPERYFECDDGERVSMYE